MDNKDRAKQFAPFDALRGLREALRQKEIEHERKPRRELSEEQADELNAALGALSRGDRAEAVFFKDGFYISVTGEVQGIDAVRRVLLIEGGKISFSDLYSIKIS